jgi:hypothetical protein
MSESTPGSPSPPSRQRLKLFVGVYLTILAAAIIAVPLWFTRVPEPSPLQPLRGPNEPAAAFDALVTTSRAAAPPVPEQPLRPTTQQQQPGAGVPEVEAPIIERRWIQGEMPPPVGDQGRWFEQPAGVVAEHGLDRSRATRRRRVQQFGGRPETEDAVEAGLTWLAAHQDQDGTWDRFEFGRHCPADDPCPGKAVGAEGYSFCPGLTGLALLAFLGAGYTDREGPYKDVVGRAVDALLEAQMAHGGFGRDERIAGYNDALATFALAEYYALTDEPRVVAPLERAVTRLVLSQQELGAWDYVRRADSGRNDTSITGWAVQALHACVAAGIPVPRRVLIKAALHFEQAAEPDGRVRYSDAGIGFRIDDKTLQPVYRYGPAMTAVGLTCEQLLGWRFDSGLVRRQQALLSQQFPSTGLLQGGDPTQLHSYYYWYYGTIAVFQAGGERWERWNAHLLDAILTLQNRRVSAAGRKPHAYGSWPPFGPNWGKWGRQGSRVYSTAVCVLTLEIYYRHMPAYLEEHAVLNADDWREFMGEADLRERRLAVETLRQMRLEVAEPVLIESLRDTDGSVARAAAVALTIFDSPLGRPVLERYRDSAPVWEREILAEALRRVQEIEALPPAQGTIRVFDAERRLAAVDLPRAYVGMVLNVRRDGQDVGRLRVIKRFTGQRIVVAELVGAWAGAPPREGDAVISG